MVTRLYLLRHGIAVPHGAPGMSDDDRPLTSKGEDHLKSIAAGLKQLGIEPNKIFTSPLPRAKKTAEIVAKALKLDDRLEDADALRPGASADSIRKWLKTRAEDVVMLVGHNPNLTDLLGLLLGLKSNPLPFELKKGGVAELRADDQGAYTLQWLAVPRLFRKLKD